MSNRKESAAKTVVLATVGSLGDLHPFMSVGLALRARGCRPVIATAEDYRAKVQAAGLDFHPLRPGYEEIERDLHLSRAALTARMVANTEFLLTKVLLPYLRDSYDDMLPLMDDAALVLTSSLAFSARLAAEKRGRPFLAVVLQPSMFLSAYDPPVIPKIEWLAGILRRVGPLPTGILFDLAKFASTGLFAPVARLRAAVGLPPDRRNPLFEGQFSPLGALGLYSGVLGGIEPDFPPRTTITGFASYDSDDGRATALPPGLQSFLEAGPAPLVFTLGSLIVNSPGSFYRESLLAARQLGRRAVLLVGDSGFEESAADVHVSDYAPHSLLFPHAAAVVHHGGIGTLAQALRTGRPQLVVPFFADQADNAARAVRIGVARGLTPRDYCAASAARELGLLLSDGSHASRAADIRARLAAEHGAEAAADVVADRLQGA